MSRLWQQRRPSSHCSPQVYRVERVWVRVGVMPCIVGPGLRPMLVDATEQRLAELVEFMNFAHAAGRRTGERQTTRQRMRRIERKAKELAGKRITEAA